MGINVTEYRHVGSKFKYMWFPCRTKGSWTKKKISIPKLVFFTYVRGETKKIVVTSIIHTKYVIL